MPTYRFRHPEEAPRSGWSDGNAEENLRALRSVSAFYQRVAGAHFPPGVHRYRGVDEAPAEGEEWLEEQVRALRQRRLAAQNKS